MLINSLRSKGGENMKVILIIALMTIYILFIKGIEVAEKVSQEAELERNIASSRPRTWEEMEEICPSIREISEEEYWEKSSYLR